MPKPTSISTNGKPILNKGEACARCKVSDCGAHELVGGGIDLSFFAGAKSPLQRLPSNVSGMRPKRTSSRRAEPSAVSLLRRAREGVVEAPQGDGDLNL